MPMVVVKTRDLDTDERARDEVPVARIPDNPLRQGQHLHELVAERFPDARAKSFADGVASFVGRQHLIIAFYASTDGGIETPPASGTGEDGAESQDQLFAA